MSGSHATPAGALVRGLLAGLAGTATMDGYEKLVSTLRGSGSGRAERRPTPFRQPRRFPGEIAARGADHGY
jgi:hypothetical protein